MLTVINALLPVFALIILGLGLKRSGWLDDGLWPGMEQLCYFALFPALIVKTLSGADLGAIEIGRFAGALISGILMMTTLLLLINMPLSRLFNLSGPAFTSLFQGITRWHAFIALSITGALYGDPGLVLIAITIAIVIPTLNVINVTVLALYAGRSTSPLGVLKLLMRNPLILACITGISLSLTGLKLPSALHDFLDILGAGALGLGLLTVGGGLRFNLSVRDGSLVAFGALARLIGMPAMMVLGCWLFDIDGMARTVIIIAGAVPTAPSSYVLARQLGGDAPLMASIISAQVLSAAITLPLILLLITS